MFFVGLFMVVVPLFLMGMLAFSRQPSKLLWGVNMLSYGLAIGFLGISGRWDVVGVWLRPLFILLFILATISGYRRIQPPEKPLSKWQTYLNVGIGLFIIVMMAGLSWQTLVGYAAPEEAIALESPLRDGRFFIVQGGSSPFINGHFHVSPQNFALDVVALNGLGIRADLFGDSEDLEIYEIFGETLYSPCEGVVIMAVDEHPDLTPPNTDVENLAGNHVVIECHKVEVVLAHMKAGSVRVAEGDEVTTETVLGQVGNSGNTSEPHLHIHLERGGVAGEILDGEGVAMQLNGRFLKRGQIIPQN